MPASPFPFSLRHRVECSQTNSVAREIHCVICTHTRTQPTRRYWVSSFGTNIRGLHSRSFLSKVPLEKRLFSVETRLRLAFGQTSIGHPAAGNSELLCASRHHEIPTQKASTQLSLTASGAGEDVRLCDSFIVQALFEI